MLDVVKQIRVHGGTLDVIEHDSSACSCRMTFAVFVPPQAAKKPVPVLYWLSGLTCTWENFATKAGAFGYAAEHGLMIVCPDTSPRGDDVPDEDGWDFGTGAGFYLNATAAPWSRHYRMEDYVVNELPGLIDSRYTVQQDYRMISGHSMGGHGALTLALKYPELYQSVSAFSPISSARSCPWGEKMLTGYLGNAEDSWSDHDACDLLLSRGWDRPILVDQGTADDFLEEQLKPELLQKAAAESGTTLSLRMQEGYDHSYYFICSFIGDHIDWHMSQLPEG